MDQNVDDGSDDDGPEAAGEWVCYESADERSEARGATEVGEGVGCLHKREI